MKIKRTPGEWFFDSFNYIFLAFLGLVCLYPLWYVFCAAFSDPTYLAATNAPLLLPINFSFESITYVMQNDRVWNGFMQSVRLLVYGTVWNMFCTIICAYPLSRRDFLLRRPIMLMITFTMFIGGTLSAVYLNFQELGFTNDKGLINLIIPFSIGTYNMVIMRTSIEGMPESLIEAARIDGAGHLRVIWNLVLPLTKATIAVLAMFFAVAHWNNWFWPTYLLDRKDQVLAVVMNQLLDPNNFELDPSFAKLEGMKHAAVVITTAPILAMYPFVQKYFTKGVMIGAVKQ